MQPVVFILAAATAAQPLTLPAALTLARAASPEARAAEAAVEAARAREVQAEALPNPNLALIVDQVPFPNPVAGNYMAGLNQPLLLGGQREARRDLGLVETRLAALDRDVVLLDLGLRLREAYADALLDAAGARLAQLALAGAEAAFQADRTRLRAGEVAPLDLARAEVEVGRARRAAQAARNRHREADARLNVLLGRPAEAALVLAAPATAVPALPPLEDLRASALASRIELRRAALAVEREVLQRRVAIAGVWTGTEVTGAVGAVGGQPGLSATLTLPIPVYRQQGEIAEAEADRRRADAEQARVRNAVVVEVEAAYRAAQDAVAEVRAFAASYVPQAERLVAAAEKRLRMGEGSGLEALDARRILLEARAEQARAEHAYRRAIARLNRAAGREATVP